jgi:hypothetical protein
VAQKNGRVSAVDVDPAEIRPPLSALTPLTDAAVRNDVFTWETDLAGCGKRAFPDADRSDSRSFG